MGTVGLLYTINDRFIGMFLIWFTNNNCSFDTLYLETTDFLKHNYLRVCISLVTVVSIHYLIDTKNDGAIRITKDQVIFFSHTD